MAEAAPAAARPTLRRYPFPYRSALAVSNDTDGMSWSAFEDWHAFVSGVGPTPHGDGLGLEVADSFWVWSDGGAFALRHAPPWNDSGAGAPEAGRIRELVAAGWLDTLHSFGDWQPGYQLTRDDVARGLEILDSLGACPRIHVNHGGGDLRQNSIGGPWWNYQGGDDPDNEAYCLRPLLDRGLRFFWTDVMYENDRFGEQLITDAPPQGGRDKSVERWLSVAERMSSAPAKTRREVLPGVDRTRADNVAAFCAANLLIPAIGRDDSRFLCFKRFRGHEAPTSATFALQASADHLDGLEEAEGVCVIYQHFGVWRALGRSKRHGSEVESRSPALDDHAVWTFRDLSERQAAGRLFVTTTARLLNYLWVRDNLRHDCERSDEILTIRIAGVDCPTYGRRDVTAEDLQGISFLVDSGSPPVVIRLAGRDEPIAAARAPDPLVAGKDAVFVPWRRMVFPAVKASPPKPAAAGRVGGPPPAQQRPPTARPLTPGQVTAFVSLITETIGREAGGPGARADLRTIRKAWRKLEFPAVYSGRDYARRMHEHSFDFYRDRLRRITAGGAVALDAGCGTASWSLPMADLFDRVIAVDANKPRIDVARWLVGRSETTRVQIDQGDITDLDLPPASVDFVFCYGVVISYLSLRAVLKEFRRVLRPGGTIYVCLNGIGWSLLLRDERGKTNPKNRVQGLRGIYNTYCRQQQPDIDERLSRLLQAAAEPGKRRARLAEAGKLSASDFEAFLASLPTAKTLADLRLAGSDAPPTAEAFVRLLDKFLVAAKAPGRPLEATLADLQRECGDEYSVQFAADLLDLLAGRRDSFNHGKAGRGYRPDEAEAICKETGFTGFQWAGEGKVVGPTGLDKPTSELFASEFNGALCVWEFVARG